MRKKGFVGTLLEIVSWITIAVIITTFTTNIVFLILLIFLCGVSSLIIDDLQGKGKFAKIDNYLNQTRVFILLKKYKKIIILVLLCISIMLAILVVY